MRCAAAFVEHLSGSYSGVMGLPLYETVGLLNGDGYPSRLSGEEIPLEARIIAAADAYEAMTADRSYRPALGEEAARAELQAGAGSQFDALVVRALLDALSGDGIAAASLPRAS